MVMKKILKKILPSSVSNKLRSVNATIQLNKLPVREFDFDALRKLDSNTLNSIFDNKDYEAEYNAIRVEVEKLELPEYTGGVNIGDQRALFHLIRHFKPKNILEVGTFVGCSTTHIGLAIRDIQGAKLTTVDIADVNNAITQPWLNLGAKYSPQENIKRVGCSDKVDFVVQDVKKYLADFSGAKYDFIFLDGSHKATDVYLEISHSLDILNEGGVILLHDFFPKNIALWKDSPDIISGPFLGVERIRKETQGKAHVIPLGSLPWETKFGTSITSLAVFTKK